MAFALTSPAFAEGGTIPNPFTCEGRDVSPLLHWSNPRRALKALP